MKFVLLCLCFVVFGSCATPLDTERITRIQGLGGDVSAGASLWSDNCMRCHGENGNGKGPSLKNSSLSDEAVIRAVLVGPLSMPNFSRLTDQEIANLNAYIDTL